jgi:hypothetical protein
VAPSTGHAVRRWSAAADANFLPDRMRALFVIYIVLIAAGLVTFTVIGLTHH